MSNNFLITLGTLATPIMLLFAFLACVDAVEKKTIRAAIRILFFLVLTGSLIFYIYQWWNAGSTKVNASRTAVTVAVKDPRSPMVPRRLVVATPAITSTTDVSGILRSPCVAPNAYAAATGTTAVEPLNCSDHGDPMLAVATSDGNPALLVVKDGTAYVAPLSDTDITPPDDDTIAYCAGICTADDLAAKTGGTITHDAGIEGDTLITADGTPRTVKLKKNPAYTALTPSN